MEKGMTDINLDGLGPVDYLVVSYQPEKADFSGEIASEPKALVQNRTIRVTNW